MSFLTDFDTSTEILWVPPNIPGEDWIGRYINNLSKSSEEEGRGWYDKWYRTVAEHRRRTNEYPTEHCEYNQASTGKRCPAALQTGNHPEKGVGDSDG